VKQTTEGYVSIVGDSYLIPISDLSEKLFSHASLFQNEVQASPLENGYSVSLCILTIAWFESYIMRVRYLNRASQQANIKKPPIPFLKALYPDLPFYDKLMEIFVLRDTLVHNHLWMIQLSWDEKAGMKLHGAEKAAFCGDKKYEKYVDFKTRKTKKLGLNVVPTRVCNTDYKVVLRTVWKGLLFIQEKDPGHFGITNLHIKVNGQLISMQKYIDQICK